MLKALTHIPGKLAKKLLASDRTIYLDAKTEAYIYSVLAPGDWAYAKVKSPTTEEVIKITAQCGLLQVTRGLDNSASSIFPVGACVHFEMTDAHVKERRCEA